MSSLVEPFLVPATGEHRGVLVWRWGTPMPVLSSAPVGGGPGVAGWVLNIGVGSDYDRTDLSDHAGEVAAELGLRGAGVAMFTAVDLSRRQRCVSGGVAVDATVGSAIPPGLPEGLRRKRRQWEARSIWWCSCRSGWIRGRP